MSPGGSPHSEAEIRKRVAESLGGCRGRDSPEAPGPESLFLCLMTLRAPARGLKD